MFRISVFWLPLLESVLAERENQKGSMEMIYPCVNGLHFFFPSPTNWGFVSL